MLLVAFLIVSLNQKKMWKPPEDQNIEYDYMKSKLKDVSFQCMTKNKIKIKCSGAKKKKKNKIKLN